MLWKRSGLRRILIILSSSLQMHVCKCICMYFVLFALILILKWSPCTLPIITSTHEEAGLFSVCYFSVTCALCAVTWGKNSDEEAEYENVNQVWMFLRAAANSYFHQSVYTRCITIGLNYGIYHRSWRMFIHLFYFVANKQITDLTQKL